MGRRCCGEAAVPDREKEYLFPGAVVGHHLGIRTRVLLWASLGW
jgi:hypothetical protein